MTRGNDARPQRPDLALRVGITGARSLQMDHVLRIESQLKDVFSLVKWQMESFRQHNTVCEFYAPCKAEDDKPRLCLISPLARGADRYAAKAASKLGYELCVPMPFKLEEYERDFTGSDESNPDEEPLTGEQDLAEFRWLLSQATGHLCLDGARKDPVTGADLEGRSYEAVGRLVVRNCDLLVAIWDGGPSRGRGGSADVIRYAATVGVPVWWISATRDDAPKWLADIQDLRDPSTSEIDAGEKLKTYLGRLVLPPDHVRRHPHGWIGRLALLGLQRECSPASTYFDEEPLGRGFPWGTHKWLMDRASHMRARKKSHRRSDESADRKTSHYKPPPEPITRYWHDRYRPADVLAGDYAARYRSSYVLVILFTTLALIFGAFASVLMSEHERVSLIMAACEFFSLIMILLLVWLSLRSEWHERSIEYRLLAELFRKQQMLAPLGWALSVGNVQHLADTGRLSWVAWLFAAAERAAPLPEQPEPLDKIGRASLNHLIDEQIVYHRGRKERCIQAAERFEFIGSAIFAAVVLCVMVKITLELLHQTGLLTEEVRLFHHGTNIYEPSVLSLAILAMILPGISAAFVAIRNYGELQLLAEQSDHMIDALERSSVRVARLNPDRPLVSQDLGAEAAVVATTMLQDLDGWGRLFRGKAMEAS